MKTETSVTTATHTKINAIDILRAFNIPENATDVKVWVDVPGGGDWSNSMLDIDPACPINVSYKEAT